MSPTVLLSFDVEEFDMPLEYRYPISEEMQMRVGKLGLDQLKPLLAQPNIETTLFTTAHFADRYPTEIAALAQKHEIASHTYFHSFFSIDHLQSSREKLEAITGQKVVGLRMPRMKQVSLGAIREAGYQYDASLHPTWIPGRYNHFFSNRTLHPDSGLVRVPASVSPVLRIPLFWLSFKNFPYQLYFRLVMKTLKKDGYVCLYFHPWEFTPIDGFGLPRYTCRGSSGRLLNRLGTLVQDLSEHATFSSMRNFLNM